MAGQGVQKREGYISWEDYFMATAVLASERSKDPNTQVGACIVDENKKIVGTGYNGMPIVCNNDGERNNDDVYHWGKNKSVLHNKHTYVCHAELNAITYRSVPNLKGCTLYVTLFPCNECAKLVIQSGIVKVWYLSDEKGHKDEFQASRHMLITAGVDIEDFKGSGTIGNKIKINWDAIKGPSGAKRRRI